VTNLAVRTLGSTDLSVTELCLGTVTFGDLAEESAAASIIDRYLDGGGNVIDTADVYSEGRAEEIVGRALRGRRDCVVLATKGGMVSASGGADASSGHLIRAVEASLRRLLTDHIDLYYVHVPDPRTPPEETLVALDELIRAGKIRHVGASNYACWQLAIALGTSDRFGFQRFVSLEAQYSLVSRDVELDLVPLCRAQDLSLMAWGSLGGGILSGKYGTAQPPPGTRLADAPATAHRVDERTAPVIAEVQRIATELDRPPAQVALRWVADRPAVASAIVGARTPEQVSDHLGIAGWRLEPSHLAALDRLTRPRLTYPHDLQRMLGCAPI
jgi:aryl-alcohol dehydrogenase-like predicted oxidoreductase